MVGPEYPGEGAISNIYSRAPLVHNAKIDINMIHNVLRKHSQKKENIVKVFRQHNQKNINIMKMC